MNTVRRRLQPSVWVALVAMLALALLPTLSHALAHARVADRAWAEVCTPQGLAQVALDDAGRARPLPFSAGVHLEHCPFCHLGADLPPGPPAAAPRVLPVAAALPPVRVHRVRPRPGVWASAQPRAPPARA